MKKISLLGILLVVSFFVGNKVFSSAAPSNSGAPPYVQEDLDPPDTDPFARLKNWTRPKGPAKVGLQVGHWKNDELPEELARLRGNTGSAGGGKAEWEVNLKIAQLTQELLEAKGIAVEILPATIPADFWADVFVAIHADGSEDLSASGFKVASPRRDFSGNARKLVSSIEDTYHTATKLEKDPNISRNMTGYYAFAWWRYDHAVHPKTAAVILETGFLTSFADRRIIVNNPNQSAQGLADGIISYLESENLLEKQ